MLNPIKRVWVPKKVDAPHADAPAANPGQTQPTPKPALARNVLFDEVPEPDVEEKNSDSIWAEFDTLIPSEAQSK